ncbi:MAG TPA: type VI secretion system tube protein Hcp [Candidatus Binatia bacterium]|nr:type VI secretion system tube protein Hcp [Candidatus Binatia bacterium]
MACIYLKLGTVRGDSKARGHEDWIELSSLQFPSMRTIDYTGENDRGLKQIVFTKPMDSASPVLRQLSISGEAQPATIDFVNTNGEIYLQLQFDDASVDGYSASSSSKGAFHSRPMESVTLKYSKMRLTQFSANVPATETNLLHDLLSTPVP